MHAEIETKEQPEQREPTPRVGVISLLPPPEHRPQHEAREGHRQHIRRELNSVFPERVAERERPSAEGPAIDGRSTETRIAVS